MKYRSSQHLSSSEPCREKFHVDARDASAGARQDGTAIKGTANDFYNEREASQKGKEVTRMVQRSHHSQERTGSSTTGPS